MPWTVQLHPDFAKEFLALDREVRVALLQRTARLEEEGPRAGRPTVDTLVGSRFANMKEIRFDAADGAWRVAFAFDPERKAILLVAGDKAGVSQKRFYKSLIATADRRFQDHLDSL